MANEEDNYYKLLATNRSDLFWKAHSNPQRKPEGFYSEEFKDLITCMLQFHPHQRLCIADIIGHPWLSSGGIAEADTVRQEFAQRHEVNKQRAMAEQERKNAQRNTVNNNPRRDFQLGGKVYLSHEEQVDASNATAEIIRLRIKDYVETQGRTHAFFSHFKPDYLLQTLTRNMQEQGQVFDISNNTWKVSFNVSKQINEPVEGEEVEPIFEQAKIQVEILKVPGQDKYCVDFQRKAGSAILFYDNANKYIDLLELCNNATLDSEAEASTQAEPMQAEIDVGGAAQQ